MNQDKYEFRPSHVGIDCSIIGMVVYRGFHDTGCGVFAPVYHPNKKIELHRLLPFKYDKHKIDKAVAPINNVLKSLIAAGARFEVRFLDRYKTGSEKDKFGKHSENSVGDIVYYTIKEESEGELVYNNPASFNDYVINYIKNDK